MTYFALSKKILDFIQSLYYTLEYVTMENMFENAAKPEDVSAVLYCFSVSVCHCYVQIGCANLFSFLFRKFNIIDNICHKSQTILFRA